MNQSLALNILKSGRNVFLTGQAGSGKTYVINQYIQWLWSCNIEVAITASTGIAATHIGWVTIHSRAGIGIKESLTHRDLELISQKERLHKQINKAKVLIIDEISMLSAHTIDMVDQVTQMIRRDGRPFGGMQAIFVGDFFQLPPVMGLLPDGSESTKRFAFAAQAWKHADLVMCYLSTQYRQWAWDFLTILNQLRKGQSEEKSLTQLKTRLHQPLKHANPVKLYTHNIDVDRINMEKLLELPSDMMNYTASGSGDAVLVAWLTKSMLAPQLLSLKEWAQVIFVKNNPTKGYMNGTTGFVVGFDKSNEYPLVQIAGGQQIKVEPELWSIEQADEIVASVKQIPLKLARAITVHKSQGMTLDAAEIDLSKVFEPGQAYVALSRIKSLDGLHLLGLNEQGLQAHPLVIRADRYFWEQSQLMFEQYSQISDELFIQIHERFIEVLGGKYVTELIPKEKKLTESTARIRKPKAPKWDSLNQTLDLIKQGKNLKDIAQDRGLAISTIMQHVFKIHALYPDVSLKQFKPDAKTLSRIRKAIQDLGNNPDYADEQWKIRLKAIFDYLDGEVSYDEIKMGLLFVYR